MSSRSNKTKKLINPKNDEIDGDFVVKYESALITAIESIAPITLDVPSRPLGEDNDFYVLNEPESTQLVKVNGHFVAPGSGIGFRWIGSWFAMITTSSEERLLTTEYWVRKHKKAYTTLCQQVCALEAIDADRRLTEQKYLIGKVRKQLQVQNQRLISLEDLNIDTRLLEGKYLINKLDKQLKTQNGRLIELEDLGVAERIASLQSIARRSKKDARWALQQLFLLEKFLMGKVELKLTTGDAEVSAAVLEATAVDEFQSTFSVRLQTVDTDGGSGVGIPLPAAGFSLVVTPTGTFTDVSISDPTVDSSLLVGGVADVVATWHTDGPSGSLDYAIGAGSDKCDFEVKVASDDKFFKNWPAITAVTKTINVVA